MRSEQRKDPDATTLAIREINRYIGTNPELRHYAREFTRIILDRMDSVAANILTACENRDIHSVDDPSYKNVEEIIESAYPTWADIKNSVINQKTVTFPTMPKYVMDGKVPLGQS